MDILKILGICLIVAVLCGLLRQYKPEYALIISALGGTMLLIFLVGQIVPAFSSLKTFLSRFGLEAFYFTVALKAVGIGYITQFIADTCRDAGQGAIASKAELAGRSGIFLLSIPLLQKILELAEQLL